MAIFRSPTNLLVDSRAPARSGGNTTAKMLPDWLVFFTCFITCAFLLDAPKDRSQGMDPPCWTA